MRRVDEPASSLKPRLDAARMGQEVPAKDDGRKAYARVCPAPDGSLKWLSEVVKRLDVRCWRIRLPERDNVAGKLELSREGAGMEYRRENLAELKACKKELEIVAVAETCSPVNERTILPATVIANLGHWVIGIR